MADQQGNNKQKVPKFGVKFVGGPRYDQKRSLRFTKNEEWSPFADVKYLNN